ncbi:MAG: hypothetical protein ACKOPS_26490, partial [Cyanobium sp.]
ARGRACALAQALAFALSPLVLLWGRIGVSDALFSATLSGALLLAWRRYAAGEGQGQGEGESEGAGNGTGTAKGNGGKGNGEDDSKGGWWQPWAVLALAVLTKGPVAVVLFGRILAAFAWIQRDRSRLIRRLRPLPGLALLTALSLPWYAHTLLREGQPYWDSFFGYHNLQRFTSVVNHHLQPWWFFGPVLVVASLPASPLLLLGLARALGPLPHGAGASSAATVAEASDSKTFAPHPERLHGGRRWLPERPQARPASFSLAPCAACWLLGVLAFFTLAATKLPSYWLPATPAAGLLISLAGFRPDAAICPAETARGRSGATADQPSGASPDRPLQRAFTATLLLALLLGGAFLAGPLWVPAIQDPELPTLPAGILASGRLPVARQLGGGEGEEGQHPQQPAGRKRGEGAGGGPW